MLKCLGLIIVSLGFMCAYAASNTTANTTAPVAQTNTNALSAGPIAAQPTPEVVTTPMVFQIGKQKVEVTQADVVAIGPTDELCTDGVAIQLTDAKGSELHDLTVQNQNQNMKVLWNGLTLGDAPISTPMGANVCIGYVDTATEQALVSEFSPPNHAATSVTIPAVQ